VLEPTALVFPMGIDRLSVEDAVAARLQAADPRQRLAAADFHEILTEVAEKVEKCMRRDDRTSIDQEDHAFIQSCVTKMVEAAFREYEEARPKRRFQKSDRVVCRIGGQRPWASGTVAALDEDDPENPTSKLPYVVKIDPPNGRLISVPRDDYDLCRAEVCFGQRAGALWFTLFCKPLRHAKASRFTVGDRVTCAIEDDTNDYSLWAAGVVVDVDCDVSADAWALVPDGEWDGYTVPYRIQLDSGCSVLAHRDEHWLVRDAELQPPGPRQASGMRCLERISKRQNGSNWEAIDHSTCRVRPTDAPDSDEETMAPLL